MKNYFLIASSFALLFSGCRHASVVEYQARPKALVKAVNFRSGELIEELMLQSRSVYLIRNNINSPVNCFVRKVFVKPGDHITEGQVLFEIATRERQAIEKTGADIDPALKEFGLVSIRAASRGIVNSVTSQVGDYTPEGQLMCQINALNSLVFKLFVPFEYNRFIKPGQNCRIETADEKVYTGIIENELDQMSLEGQTRQYIVRPVTNEFIPENLLANIKITIRKVQSNQILPAECVLADEMMQNFWIMKLINDSVAVRVNIRTGLKTKDEVEVTEPLFEENARILSSGNYGLSDTALVRIEE